MRETSYKMEDLIPIVAKLAEQYTGYESTSVTYEKANQLMEAVIYCIREYETAVSREQAAAKKERAVAKQEGTEEAAEQEQAALKQEGTAEEEEAEQERAAAKQEGTAEEEAEAVKEEIAAREEVTAKEAYELGCQLVEAKVRAMKEMYHALLPDFRSYGNIALKDAAAAVPEFLKWYDMRYDPQNTILTLDYPVLVDLRQYSGIDAVYEYVRCICIEQRFLSRFPDAYVTDVLRAYSEEYEEMFENLCGILLADAVKHILLKKPFDGEGLAEDSRARVQAALGIYSEQEAKETVREIVRDLIREFYDDDGEMWLYIEGECDNIAYRIWRGLR